MRFPAIVAGAVAGAAALIPASAVAAPTIAGPSFAGIYVNAAAGTDNEIVITYKARAGPGGPYWAHIVTDDAGVVAKSSVNGGCDQVGPTTAECPDTTSFDSFDPSQPGQGESFTILLRDGQDTFIFNSPDSPEVYGGAGHDILIGNSMPAPGVGHLGDKLSGGKGNDIINGRAGPDLVGGGAGKDILAGGEGRDQLVGGGGNDRLNARDGTRDTFVSCGGGDRDRAIVDQNDPKPIGCEIVRHG